MTKQDVADMVTSYAKRTDGEFPIILSPSAKKRLVSLVLWARDRRRAGQVIEFPKVHNGDIVDGLWSKIQDPDLQYYLSSLMIDYENNPRDYKLILQSIAAKIASNKSSGGSFGGRNVSAVTRAGDCPATGAHTADGSLYIGNYSAD
eukprot:scaffold5113_cov72-Cylindrotheca_fusiformis.AAC.1